MDTMQKINSTANESKFTPLTNAWTMVSDIIAAMADNIVMVSDHISNVFPLWADFLKNLHHITGLKKRHLLFLLVSLTGKFHFCVLLSHF